MSAAQSTRRAQSAGGTSLTLISAIKKGHFHVIRDLVDRGCNVNERDPTENRTPLMLCAVVEDEKWALSVARLLIENGAKIWLTDKTGKNALMTACLNERQSLIEVLLQSLDFNLNAQDKFGCTVLHHSGLCGNIEICKIILNRLLRYDLPILVPNKENKTPVDCALELGYFECAELISEDTKIQKRNWESKRREMERKRAEDREKFLKQFQKISTASVIGTAEQNNEHFMNKNPVLETVNEGGSTNAVASYVDAVEIPVIDQSANGTVNEAQFKPMLRHALDQLVEQDEEPKLDDIIYTDYPDKVDSPKGAQSISRPKTSNSRKYSPGRFEAKPKLSSTPRIRSANNHQVNLNTTTSINNQTSISVTSVLKQTRDRDMTAKRQEIRRAVSALPNRKRVRESKISFQSRKSGEILLNRPRTALGTSVILNKDQIVYTSFVRPLFEVYREHLTDAFRPSVAAIQHAHEERLRIKLEGLEGAEGGKRDHMMGGPVGGGGRDSVDSARKMKGKKKLSHPSPVAKRK